MKKEKKNKRGKGRDKRKSYIYVLKLLRTYDLIVYLRIISINSYEEVGT